MNSIAKSTPFPDFDAWLEANDDELWAEFHETGACYDTDYEPWLEQKYEHARYRMKSVVRGKT